MVFPEGTRVLYIGPKHPGDKSADYGTVGHISNKSTTEVLYDKEKKSFGSITAYLIRANSCGIRKKK